MLKSKLYNTIQSVLMDHLDDTLDEDDIQVLAKDMVDELSTAFREVEDDDGVFKANDLGFYTDEEE